MSSASSASSASSRPQPRTRALLAAGVAAALLVGLAPPTGTLAAAAPAGGRYDAAVGTPKEDPYYPAKGDPRVDALHYGLNLRWAPASRTLTGTARIRFRAAVTTSTVQLDLGDPLRVRRVALDGRRVPFTHPGNLLRVRTGELPRDSRHTLVVVYRGTPRAVRAPAERSDVARVGWRTTRSGAVWTMQEPWGALTWYPVNDHPSDKAFYDATIDVPARFIGVFNGRLVTRRTADRRTITRWHLASPAASYLTTIAIGDYVRYRDTGPHGLPITYWVPRSKATRLLPSLRRTPAMIRWLERRLGRYPFDRAGAVLVPTWSAMETQTLLTMGAPMIADKREFAAVLVHEYAHQWYGDTVTPDNWKDLWLNESFAMYTQIRWEVSRGWSTTRQWRRLLYDLDQDMRTEDGPPGEYRRTRFASGCVYYCGALMLDRLRAKVGERAFADLWRAWPQRHRYGSADRADYARWASRRTGRDLEPFLTRWLTSPRTP